MKYLKCFQPLIQPNPVAIMDEISTKMLKETALSMTPAVTKLFNMSISLGVLPNEWKIARVSPVSKSSTRSDPTNYCPISLLSVFSKLLEKHMRDILLDHLTQFSPMGFLSEQICHLCAASCYRPLASMAGFRFGYMCCSYSLTIRKRSTQYHTDLS